MRKINHLISRLFIGVFVSLALVASHAQATEMGKDSCAELIDGSPSEIEFYDSWIRGFLSGRMNRPAEMRTESNFFTRVWNLCQSSPDLTVHAASNATYLSGGLSQ